MRNHIRELGRKDYQQLPGVRTLDYVLMFVAVEPAFLTAMEADPSLVRYGLDNNILLVSPTNLMVALRTIENLLRPALQSVVQPRGVGLQRLGRSQSGAAVRGLRDLGGRAAANVRVAVTGHGACRAGKGREAAAWRSGPVTLQSAKSRGENAVIV